MATYPSGVYSATTPVAGAAGSPRSGSTSPATLFTALYNEVVALETALWTSGTPQFKSVGVGGAADGTTGNITATGSVKAGANAAPFPLTTQSGHITVDVTIAVNAFTTIFSTGSLSVGTWLLTVGLCLVPGDTTHAVSFALNPGTATASYDGIRCGEVLGSTNEQTVTLSIVLTVTVAGTMSLVAQTPPGSTAGTAKATSVLQGYPNVTGYTAIKIG